MMRDRLLIRLRRRYEAWVLGDGVKDDQREPVRIRLNELKAYIRRGYRSLADYEIRREDDRILGKPLFAELSPYERLFFRVFFRVFCCVWCWIIG